MTEIQKIIKYCALALAVFLILIIVTTIVNIGYNILEKTDLINDDNSKILKNNIVISNNESEIREIDIDIKSSNIILKTAKNFKVETNNKDIKYSYEDGKVLIKQNNVNKWYLNKNNNSKLIVYIPSEISLEKINLKNNVGNIKIDFEKISNLNIDLDVGDIFVKSIIGGKNIIKSNVGDINLELLLKQEDYKFEFDKDIGDTKLNNNKIKKDTIIGNGNNILKIKTNIGDINVNTF